MEYNFGENVEEYSQKQGKKIPVWQSDKYKESKKKACEIIESGKYGLSPADFWILMNETKSGKMGYTGLIISHNGCLKINDKLEKPFNPMAVTEDKCGYGGALVFTYCDKDQGLYEVGEVTQKNCKNDYPYAMAFKRMFDRVVLKLSKLAYSGIYSEAESDTFRDLVDDTRTQTDVKAENAPKQDKKPTKEEMAAFNAQYKREVKKNTCKDCGMPIYPVTHGGKLYSVAEIAENAINTYKAPLCWSCMMARRKANESPAS